MSSAGDYNEVACFSGGTKNFCLGAIAQGVYGMEVPIGSRCEAQVGSLGMKSPEAEAVCRYCLQILTAEMIKNLKISHNSLTDS